MESLKRFDAYAKTMDDFRIKTHTGALLSISSLAVVVLLVMSEWTDYRSIHTNSELIVDRTRRERLKINLNITFPKIPCHMVSMDVMDVSGEQQNAVSHSVFKRRLDRDGHWILNKTTEGTAVEDPSYCGDCYGADPSEGQKCCNSCNEVQEAYARKGWAIDHFNKIEQCVKEGWTDQMNFNSGEGCNLHGHVTVNKVAGNFHFAPGRSFHFNNMHVHDVNAIADILDQFDFAHTINHLSFGDQFEGVVNPLDNNMKLPGQGIKMLIQYYVKVVPTQVKYLDGRSLSTNQYSVTQHEKSTDKNAMPGVFFNYDISPMMVIYAESRKSFTSFLTGVCAIVGGVLTLAGLLDTFFYSAEHVLKRKVELGKHN